ncbi:glycosyltransferase family 2 protein [Flavobacterium poyangense]|uniref:glycosyltransferase family 2 protein n=1 Tax=Flavobacterium poyangense TaxID=2204302 RepID=UPI0014225230|nr:glycosyltransferase [Flavobacterium sp. JXAS1]
MAQIKVSVIIPVYNAEVFLVDCVKSMMNQTLKECEFIFINDGSSDNSRQIIEDFQKDDKRIKIINQDNAGRSAARNAGIANATGKYIGFVDSDDFVSQDMFEELYKKASEFDTDIVVSSYFLGRDNKYIFKDAVFPVNIIYDQRFIQNNIISNLLEREDLFAVWNKIYKKELITAHNIIFPNEYEEDQMFNLNIFNTASNVLFVDYSGYFYREVFDGVSKNIFKIDYFEIARQKFHFDYKTRFNLIIDDKEFEKLKAIRFIQKVFYLVFKYGTVKISFAYKIKKIKSMTFDSEVCMLAMKYGDDILKGQGTFEVLVLKIIKSKSLIGLYLLIFVIKLAYYPKVSEILRNLNNLKIKKTRNFA